VQLGRNSLSYSFAEAAVKAKMLHDYDAAVAAFEWRYSNSNWRERLKEIKPLVSGYAGRTWGFND